MLNFLNGIQDRYLLLLCFVITMGLYVFFTVDAILQLMINFAVAIIAISKRPSVPDMNVDTMSTGSMDNAQIRTDNISVGDENAQRQ